ncbi:TPA: transglutaminase domain-containing protein, partial [Candidatus Woesearchaeota archaeon]|nr:transglutaminase domain-containing protein [Candidatus Woesearchaeota archaeon]
RSLISSTGIILEPQIPDILTPKFSVRKISVNGKAIPLSYLSIRPPSVARGSHYYLDISRLAKDGVLSEADFDRPLDVRIRSSAVSKAPKKGLVYLLLADKGYKDLPDYVKQHTLSTEKFPADHDGVQALVRAYNGPDEMMAKLLYTLLVTDNILEYKVQEDDLPLSRVFQRGEGDCSEYSNLFVSMARAFGIPARKRTGAVLDDDGKVDGYHAWVEVLVPLKGGVGEWMLVEPTWADDKARPFDYVSYQTRKHVYFVDFDVSLVGGDVRSDYSVFQHHMWVSRARKEGGKDGG